MMMKAYHTFLGFSWCILFADVAVINITFQVVFTYDIFFGVIHKALIGMGVNFLHGKLSFLEVILVLYV